jgi:Raf kinase inhibitor-like YbhB/YbcL family protein
MRVISPAFGNNQPIPPKYSCKGADISPELQWEDAPAGAGSFVLICEDPDAPFGAWTHWVLFDIPAAAVSLPENIPSLDILENGATHGKNSWGRNDYGGPCPPSGVHRYFFTLYALDLASLELKPGASIKRIQSAMASHVLEKAVLIGTFA